MATHPVLYPGANNKAVITAKKLVVGHLKAYGRTALAGAINTRSTRYGAGAVKGVKYIQKRHNLVEDGIIGPNTWKALESPVATSSKKVHKPSVQYDGRKRGYTHGASTPKIIVLHDTESHDYAGLKDVIGVLEYLHRTPDQLNVHLVIDRSGNTGQGANFNRMVWHARGANTNSIGIEQIGFASFGFLGWWNRRRQLRKVAKWLAYLSKTYKIPLTHSTTHGVCMHKDIPAGGHSDPGAGYPFHRVMRMARRYTRYGW